MGARVKVETHETYFKITHKWDLERSSPNSTHCYPPSLLCHMLENSQNRSSVGGFILRLFRGSYKRGWIWSEKGGGDGKLKKINQESTLLAFGKHTDLVGITTAFVLYLWNYFHILRKPNPPLEGSPGRSTTKIEDNLLEAAWNTDIRRSMTDVVWMAEGYPRKNC